LKPWGIGAKKKTLDETFGVERANQKSAFGAGSADAYRSGIAVQGVENVEVGRQPK
jgi:hypothetical protein